MIDKTHRYLYLLEIYNKDGSMIETTTYLSKDTEDTVFWRVWDLIDYSKYDFHITYLGVQGRKRNLTKIQNELI